MSSKTEIDSKTEPAKHSWNKFLVRNIFGWSMIFAFILIIYLGKIAICVFILFIQFITFRELLNVRYKIVHNKGPIPLFRTVQWLWFSFAAYYVWTDFTIILSEIYSFNNYRLFLGFIRYRSFISFLFYIILFMATTLSFRKSLLRFQFSQLAWTLLIIFLVLVQAKSNIGLFLRNGLFWFFYPVSLVVCNDCFAYFSGFFFGRKYITKTPFFYKLSPNKTWEGFIGGFIITIFFSFYWAKFLAVFFPSMTTPEILASNSNYEFMDLQSLFVSKFYSYSVELIPNYYTICIEFAALPIQLHGLIFGMLASFVAPFGGFFASAIKRAYSTKDFSDVIPGHGGIMDRMDCMFLMLLATTAYFYAFLYNSDNYSLSQVLGIVETLTIQDQIDLFHSLGSRLNITI